MTIEAYTVSQINTLISGYEKLEIKVRIDDKSYSVDFVATINGQRMQCLDLIDERTISATAYDTVAKSVANFVRSSTDYNPGVVNKFKFTVNHSH